MARDPAAGATSDLGSRLDDFADFATPSNGGSARARSRVRPGRDASDDMVGGDDAQLWPTFTDDQLEHVARFATCCEFAPGETLFEHGQKGAPLYFITEGCVRFLERKPNGTAGGDREFLLAEAPNLIGDISMFTGEPTVAACLAQNKVKAMCIAPDQLRALVAEYSDIGDNILGSFLARRAWLRDNHLGHMQLIGSRNSRETFALRDFLTRNQMPFEWSDPDRDEGTQTLLDHLNICKNDTPVLVAGASVCRRPSVVEVARQLNLKPDVGGETYDLVVVGAGPAGLAAAVYGASEGLRTLALDGDSPGGQAGTSSKIENYLGFATGISGGELARQARKFGAVLSNPTRVKALACSPTGDHKTLTLDDGQAVQAKAVVISTGAEYRRLNAEGFERFEGSGVYYAAGYPEAVQCKGEHVVVIGGGNSAGQAAVFMSQHSEKVTVVIRGDDLAKSMSQYLTSRIAKADNIELVTRTNVTALHGDGALQEATLAGPDGERRVPASAVFVMIGALPRTEWLAEGDCVGMCPKGFIATGEHAQGHARFADHWKLDRRPFLLETTQPGIFAVGDVRSGSVKRVASAVGEGSMAVKFVHEVLQAREAAASA